MDLFSESNSNDELIGLDEHGMLKKSQVLLQQWAVPKKYKLSKFIGRGSFGEIAEAFCNGDKRVAIKYCAGLFQTGPTMLNPTETAAKKLRELHLLHALKSPNVINLLDAFTDPPINSGQSLRDLYLVLEWADSDLHSFLHGSRFLAASEVASLLNQLLSGLHFLHSAHVIHRDLKPKSIRLPHTHTLSICILSLLNASPPMSRVIFPI